MSSLETLEIHAEHHAFSTVEKPDFLEDVDHESFLGDIEHHVLEGRDDLELMHPGLAHDDLVQKCLDYLPELRQ